MHRFAPQCCRIDLAALSARRQPKNNCECGKKTGMPAPLPANPAQTMLFAQAAACGA
jgi:hypothetical protein